jgi:hypothetical protein
MNAAGFEKAMRESPGGIPVSDGSRYEPVAERTPLDARQCVTAINALIDSIAVRAVIYQQPGRGNYEYEVRVDGYPAPGSPVKGFSTVSQAVLEAKGSLLRWIGEVLERV